MPGLILWKTQHINRLKKDIDTMFDRVWGEYGIASAHRIVRRLPTFELTETEAAIILLADLPEVDPEDMEIAVTGDLITIRGKAHRASLKNGNNFYRTFDSFIRTIKLPCRIDIDEAAAVYENGILKILMPKAPQEKTRIIKITRIQR
jgi:HSP20 family protein